MISTALGTGLFEIHNSDDAVSLERYFRVILSALNIYRVEYLTNNDKGKGEGQETRVLGQSVSQRWTFHMSQHHIT